MAKAKSKVRQVNFNNPKTMQTIRYLQLTENRLNRQDMLFLAGKDILYSLKNSGYIKESSKGIYQGTDKLHIYMKKQDGSTFSKSNSIEHASKIRNSLQLLSQQVILDGRFQTGTDLQLEYQRFRKQKEYQEALHREKETLQNRMRELSELHKDFVNSDSKREAERLQENINYRAYKDNLERSDNLLREESFSPPDYAVHMTNEEGEAYYNQLMEYRNSLMEHSKEYELYSKAMEKLGSILIGEDFTLGIEIITNSYGIVDLEKHAIYERVTGQNVIYLT